MSLALYEISNQYQQLFNQIETEEDIDNNILNKLDEVKDLMENKAIALASFIKNIEAERKMIDEAEKAMSNRKHQLSKKMENLTEYLTLNMKRCGITEINRSPYFVIKLKKCPPSVIIKDENLIPDEYKKTKEIITVDKIKIKEEINQGVVIDGAELQTNNVRLEIK